MNIQPNILVADLLAALPVLPASAGWWDCFCCDGGLGVDVDGDGWGAKSDNCTLVFNPSQTDSDYDGCGNACDADFNQDGVVSVGDFSALAGMLNGPPGPSGTVSGTTACP